MQHHILLVDDDPAMIRMIAKCLSEHAQLRFATDGPAALAQIRANPPDLVLLDAEMPGMDGYRVCEAMQEDPEMLGIPVIFVTSHGEEVFELKGLQAGAVDFISKPISEPLLLARVRTQLKIKRLTDELHKLATIDALTETLNRRSFDEALDREYRRALRSAEPLSLIMLDVDEFKRYNDHYGHPAGDACLRQVAAALRATVRRPADFVARYGGEEFAVLLPQTPQAGAQRIANLLLKAVEDLRVPHEQSTSAAHVTVSIGVSTLCLSDSGETLPHRSGEGNVQIASASDLVESADLALYRAKQAGRAQAWFLEPRQDRAIGNTASQIIRQSAAEP